MLATAPTLYSHSFPKTAISSGHSLAVCVAVAAAAFRSRAIKCLLVAICDYALHPAISCSDWAYVTACSVETNSIIRNPFASYFTSSEGELPWKRNVVA